MSEPDYVEEVSPLQRWFTRPPYFGAWILAGFLLGAVIAAVVLRPRAEAPASQVVQVPATPPAGQPLVQVSPRETEEPAPEVTVRSVPSANAPANAPSPGSAPGNTPEPGMPPEGSEPPPPTSEPLEVPEPEPPAPPTTPEMPEPEPEIVPPPREVEPPVARPRRRIPRAEPVPVPRRDTGRVSVFFDADSSTFDRRGRRLPLRVEVYVNGEKRLESTDPEKREFNLGRLPEGEHDIEIVPYVGNLPAETRRERVRVQARERNEFQAVLRREDGRSRVSKFRERD